MRTTEHIAKSASTPKTGLLATLSNPHRVKGSGAPSTGTSRALVLTLATIALVLCLVSIAPSAALAARGHVFSRSFGGKGPGSGQFEEPSGVAVNEATGDVYGVDRGDNRVEWFSSAGAFLGQFNGTEIDGLPAGLGKEAPSKFSFPSVEDEASGIAIDNDPSSPSHGDVYVVDAGNGVVDKFTATGEYINQLTVSGEGSELDGVGVDPRGDLWVATHGTHAFEFSNTEANELIGGGGAHDEYQYGPYNNPGFAVDPEDDLYLRTEFGLIYKVGPKGELLNKEVDPQGASGLAVELSSDDVYIDSTETVARIGPNGLIEGEPIERLGEGRLKRGTGVAVNSAGETVYVANDETDVVESYTLEEPKLPTVTKESASEVTGDSATFEAEVNPRSKSGEESTRYHFEYGRCTSLGACATSGYEHSVPVSDGVLAPSFGLDTVGPVHVQGLSPGTVYHFRVIAINSHGVAEGERNGQGEEVGKGGEVVHTFTTQTAGSFALPDGREWEMVSPQDKHGALINSIKYEEVIQAAAGGSAIVYSATAPTESEPPGYTYNAQVLSVRGQDGWSSRVITPPHPAATGVPVGIGNDYRFFSEDLSLGVAHPIGPFDPSLSAEASEQTSFLHTDYLNGDVDEPCVSSCYRPLVTGAPGFANVPEGTHFGEKEHEEFKCDLCGPEAVGGTPDLSHVVLSSPVSLTESGAGNLYEWSAGKLTFIGGGELGNHNSQVARHAISNDGSRVFFTGGEGNNHLYMRDVPKEETVELGEAGFQDASSDGSRVFFTTGNEGIGGALYECESREGKGGKLECKLSDLSAGAGVQGLVLGASKDGSWVYFVSGDALDVRHDGTTKLVATLSGEDGEDWSNSPTAQVSSSGHWLAFMSDRNLTGYDTRDAVSGKPDEEVYMYNGETERLVCASCNPTGARPVAAGNDAARIPGLTNYRLSHSLYQSRYLSDSGRLFFNSYDELAPQAVNGNWDVYEYEPQGVGPEGAQCGPQADSGSDTFKPAHSFEVESRKGEEPAGCVGLISSGGTSEESEFIDASETGGDAFFRTVAKLSPQDTEGSVSIYDAHECTSASPCTPPSAVQPPPCTTADACRAAPTPQPSIFGAPSSATFSGDGNLSPAAPTVVKPTPKAKPVACRKGFERKHNRCVRKSKTLKARKTNRRAR